MDDERRERQRAYQAAWYQANRERIAAVRRKGPHVYPVPTEEELERRRERKREGARRLGRGRNDYQRAYKARDPEKWSAYYREWRAAHSTPQRRFGLNANKAARRRGNMERLDWKNLSLGPCTYCGIDDETVTWDHVMPLARGGRNHSSNCVRACLPCNRRKQDFTPDEWRDIEGRERHRAAWRERYKVIRKMREPEYVARRREQRRAARAAARAA